MLTFFNITNETVLPKIFLSNVEYYELVKYEYNKVNFILIKISIDLIFIFLFFILKNHKNYHFFKIFILFNKLKRMK